MRLVWIVVACIGLAGCVGPWDAPGGVSGTTWSEAASMAPDFAGDGPSYPVLLLHQHATASEAQKRQWENVVCLTAGGETIPIENPFAAADMAACMPEPYDAATGRVYAEPTSDWGGPALVLLAGCNGGLAVLPDDGIMRYQAPEREFLIEWVGDGFEVDGRPLEPGRTLKVDYWIDRGDAEHERRVKVAFDHPGQWLYSMVGDPYQEGLPRPAAPPTMGSGARAAIDIEAFDLAEILAPVWEATPGATGITDLRIVRQDVLTSVQATVSTGQLAYAWYSAARDDGTLRMLAEIAPTDEPGQSYEGLTAFGGLDELPAADGFVTSWRLVRGQEVHGVLLPAQPHCSECMYRWVDDLLGTGWRWAAAGTLVEGSGATLLVEVDAIDGRQTAYLTR